MPRDRWLMDPTKAFDNVGPEPVYDSAVLEAAEARVAARAEVKRQAQVEALPAERRAAIIAALRSYTGPVNKRGLPKRRPLNFHAGFKIQGWEKRECWPWSGGE